MKNVSAVLLVCACLGLLYGQAGKPSSDAEAVKQLERDWIAAQKAVDIGKLGLIFADEWSGLGPDGNKSTKKQYLNDVKTGVSKLDSIEIGAMEVKMM